MSKEQSLQGPGRIRLDRGELSDDDKIRGIRRRLRRRVSEISPTVAVGFDGGENRGEKVFAGAGAAF